jgi:hypothetical protein
MSLKENYEQVPRYGNKHWNVSLKGTTQDELICAHESEQKAEHLPL